MKVAVDGRSLADAGAGRGVAHYTSALLSALAAAQPDDEYHVLLIGDGDNSAPTAPNIHVHRIRRPPRLMHAGGALTGRPRLDRLVDAPVEVFWAPAPAPLAISSEMPLVLTLHDLSWKQRPGDFTAYERLWHQLARPARLVRRATRVMAVSSETQEQALREWDLDPSRVSVVHSGVTRPASPAPEEVSRARKTAGLTRRYLVFVGALEPRKAPDLLMRAYANARARGLDAELALVGSGRMAEALQGPGVHVLGAVGDATRDALCAGALSLVLPSWLEGFGLPPLEALALGTPSVLSDLRVYDETIGDGALRFVPGDEVGLADALLAIAGDPELRVRLVARGRAATAELTWERTATQARSVLAEAAGEARHA